MDVNNARITGTMLGIEDHGIFTFMLHFDTERFGISWPGMALDYRDPDTKNFKGWEHTALALRAILDTVGVEQWEKLQGSHCRIVREGMLGGRIRGIGHLLKDQWLCIDASGPFKGTYEECFEEPA